MKIVRFVLLVSVLCLTGCSRFSEKFGSNNQIQGASAKQLFTTGEKAMANNNYETAVQYFESLDSQYPFSPYAQQMLLNLIYSYHRTGDNAAAGATAQRFIHLYPRAKHVDYAYYMKGIANFEQEHGTFTKYLPIDPALRDRGTSVESYNDFSTYMRRFPRSPYRADARQRMIYLRNIFARKELYAARLYMKRKAYVAAANRANTVVKSYSQSPQTPEALAIMVQANRKLGLQRQADEAMAVLKLNYPNSSWYRSVS